MANIDLNFSDDTTQQLTLTTVNGIQNIPIVFNGTTTNVPFERFVLADESVVFIFVLTAFISSGMLLNQNPSKFRMGFGLNKNAMVVPTRGAQGDVWDFQYQIRFNNDQSDYSVIEVISGEMPPGLKVDSTATSTDRASISGKVDKTAFAVDTWQDKGSYNFEQAGFNTAKLELLDITYVEKISHTPTIISNPTNVFTAGSILQNVQGDSRIIESVSTYDDNGVTKTKIVVPYVDKINRNGYYEFEAFELPRNEVIENNKMTSKKDADFKGYVKRGNIFAYYKDIKTVVETSAVDAQHEKDYTFTLGMRSSNSTTYHAQQQFTIRVLQNHDNVRDEFQAFNNYPAIDVYYDPTKKVYVVDYILSLTRFDGSSANIPLTDGVLPFNMNNEIEAFGELSLLRNDDGVRTEVNITLSAGT